ncbi:MAG: class I SAM-dependent methyltransferase [Rhodospirillaceae bacterium]|jgi:2-polyprenyl-6-hydroxyphenyl methylase/3-demethylubiquinone-9 3-methyltransferase|nr:class I SAM-dependent methyltransferase [Rhodospirillales bacterium]MBT3904609.1 class I SAM-dependent methyltransferase [Rhodospirillaceae bacterium]MBT4700692.1 class I SAM-dependent methyltransferase [Rhodospirillaceae bacterium]MBT5032898.1 class I SAM-dependent methyltransferase [Rhodospirillaceae bacterium]MBT6221417.1 class I SAM-dependent methyltransferase [Rhodospirillaceae bacterium]
MAELGSAIPLPAAASPKEPCKICGGKSALFGTLDFNRACSEILGIKLPPFGVPVYYHRCEKCGFLFTTGFDEWNSENFETWIYNDDYITIDPDYKDVRPKVFADLFIKNLGDFKETLSILDFGGGDGQMVTLLKQAGFTNIEWYDPFTSEEKSVPTGPYDLVTCIEVMEHTTTPHETVQSIAKLVGEDSAVLISTKIQPDTILSERLNWWYVRPRNGHVSIYTKKALSELWKDYGFQMIHRSSGTHIAYKGNPKYLNIIQ